jgi:hypothetical protein
MCLAVAGNAACSSASYYLPMIGLAKAYLWEISMMHLSDGIIPVNQALRQYNTALDTRHS